MKTNLPKILITGAGGFIGANLVRRLLPNYEIHIIWKSKTNPWRLREILPQLKLHEVDLSNLVALTGVFKQVQPTAIYHLAAHGAYSTQTDVEQMIKVNIRGTLNLLQASLTVPYRFFVNTGSSSEYGFKKKPMKETDLLVPNSFYAATKACATHLCQIFARDHHKPIITFRLFSAYGPYEKGSRFIPTLMQAILDKQTIQLTPGQQRRDFIYIDDIVEAYLAVTQIKQLTPGAIYNLGTGQQYSNDEVVKTLFDVVKKQVPVEKGAYSARTWDTSFWVADNSLAKRVLGWRPRYSLKNGLAAMYKWFKINQFLYV